MMGFGGRTALVSGAASGLGRAFAIGLAQRGASLALLDIDSCKDTLNALTALGADAKAWHCDVSDETCVAKVLQEVCDHFGTIELLVACAGIHTSSPFEKLTFKQWRQQLQVDLDGSFLLCHGLWSRMKAQEYGRILLLTGVSGLFGDPFESAWASAKMALLGLTNSLSREGSNTNIRVNSLCPMATTPMTEKHLALSVQPLFGLDAPLAAGLFLLSEQAPNGQHLMAAAGSISRVRVAESEPGYFNACACSPELLAKAWPELSQAVPSGLCDSGEAQIVKWARQAAEEHNIEIE
ncbi:short-chain dehydrogenase/reductase [Shewanella carassii]|uniref:SDR family NAD(P)-dependent oxidoreductase n=1 Tax=Shewanella carassii TaxID=1987584 RepID=UPI001BF0131D|nr:SDR family oxidoreductase [Shewanella carassii]BCV65988.1 short-chain dehydrogenase/reductase [Shewanella carassii]